MAVAISVLIFVILSFSIIILTIGTTRNFILRRMKSIGEIPGAVQLPEMSRSPRERILQPLLDKLSAVVGSAAPSTMLSSADTRLAQAGNPWGLHAKTFLLLQGVAALGGLVLGWIVASHLSANLSIESLIVIGGCGIGGVLPAILVDNRAAARKAAINKALPNMIDLLVVSVEAGLGLDGAIKELLQREEGPLMDEFSQALTEIRLGKPRAAAWHSLAERSQVRDLSAFTAALCQAEELGTSITSVLRTHSDTLRIKRTLRVRELAGTIPIKMLFPLIFFIFPSMFVVILGPAAISIMESFGNLGS